MAFSTPIRENVEQIIVTASNFGALSSLEQLGGREVYVNPVTVYYENLQKVNASLRASGHEPIVIRTADPRLTNDDLIQMVNAGLIMQVIPRYAAASPINIGDVKSNSTANIHQSLVQLNVSQPGMDVLLCQRSRYLLCKCYTNTQPDRTALRFRGDVDWSAARGVLNPLTGALPQSAAVAVQFAQRQETLHCRTSPVCNPSIRGQPS